MWTDLGVAAALGPALFAWVSGRRLVRMADDPALLEEPGRRLAWRLDLAQPPVEVVYRSGRLGTVSRDRDGITVRLYEVN
jgi:hypothetical protein